MKNTVENAIKYMLENHRDETYNDFINNITKKGIANIMVGYANTLKTK